MKCLNSFSAASRCQHREEGRMNAHRRRWRRCCCCCCCCCRIISTADFIAKYQETLIITNTLLPWMNSPVTFNDVIVDLPHQSPIHHLWLINISSYESLIMGLLWNTSSNLMSLMRPPLENHLAKAREAAGPLVALTLTPLLRTCQSALRMQLPPSSTFSAGIQMCFLMQTR